MDPQTFLDNFGTIAEAPGGVEQLRQLILALAVRGKLVASEPDDEPASVLLDRVAIERGEREASGELSRTKPLQVHEAPFEIPQVWQWATIATAAHLEMGQSPPSAHYNQVGEGIPFFQGKADFGRNHPTARYWCTKPTKRATSGDVLLSVRAPVGPSNLAMEDCCIGRGLARLRPLGGMPSRWILIVLRAFEQALAAKGTGTTFVAVSKKIIEPIPFPVPPLHEQHRIVAKVDELMRLCDDLEVRQQARHRIFTHLRASSLDALTNAETDDDLHTAWSRIRANWEALTDHPDSIDTLRQTILHLAVRGLLVARDPTPAATAVELIEATKRHRDEVSEARALRRPKELSSLNALPKPFGLPAGWEWARFTELGELSRGRSQHRPRNDPALYTHGTVPLVQTGDVARADGQINTWSALYNEHGVEQSRLWPTGTLCITIAANIADSALLSFDACFPDSVVGFVPFEPIPDARYFEYFIRTAQAHLEQFAPATAQKNINLAILDELLVPLPPLDEMRRIVDKIEALLTLCDGLESRLSERDKTSDMLAKSLAGTA